LNLRLNSPYPFYYSSFKSIAGTAAALTVAVFLFIYIIEPFSYNFDEHRYSFLVISLLNGILVGTVITIFLLLLKFTTPTLFQEENWTVGKEISLWLSLLLFIGVANFFLRELIYDNPDNFSLRYLITEISNTYVVGSLFALVAIMANYIHLLRSSTEKSIEWNELFEGQANFQEEDSQITVTSPSSQDTQSFKISDFLFAKSDGNYVEFEIKSETGTTNRKIARNTLSNVYDQLSRYDKIVRVHRSYIVNLEHVQSVSGNAQGYKISLHHTDILIPVSRTYIPVLDAVLKKYSV
jgi:hypothetical protein